MENIEFLQENRNEMNDFSAFNYGINDDSKIEQKTRDGHNEHQSNELQTKSMQLYSTR
jgi:hypothetical protein